MTAEASAGAAEEEGSVRAEEGSEGGSRSVGWRLIGGATVIGAWGDGSQGAPHSGQTWEAPAWPFGQIQVTAMRHPPPSSSLPSYTASRRSERGSLPRVRPSVRASSPPP